MTDTVGILLITGEEVIGQIKSENDHGIDIDNALLVHYSITETGNMAVYFRKYTLLTKYYNVYFKKEHVLNIFNDIDLNVEESYQHALQMSKEFDMDILDSMEQELADDTPESEKETIH